VSQGCTEPRYILAAPNVTVVPAFDDIGDFGIAVRYVLAGAEVDFHTLDQR